jgi:ribonucleoside-diphosphate reductase alpha chain
MSDYAWLTEHSLSFLQKDYLCEGQSVDERVDEMVNKAEEILQRPGFAAKFKEMFKKGWFSLSTPIWTNFGNDRGLPISCFGSFMEDSIASIALTHAEVMMMTKHGGGTSAHFGELRNRGSEITNNGHSDGPVHFMRLYEGLINVISQGKTRRGNFAAYLPVDHKDIVEFLTLRTEGSPIQDLSFGVTVPDYWMQEMVDGDPEKRKIWAKILESRSNTGFPYIVFIDNANNNTVDVYKDKNMKISHSNLCVTGDQLVVTSQGMQRVIDLYNEGKDLVLFDGQKQVKASPMRLIEKNADVYEIKTRSGRSHRVTGYHKVKTENGMVAAQDLKAGNKVCIQNKKGIFGSFKNQKIAEFIGKCQSKFMKSESYLINSFKKESSDSEYPVYNMYSFVKNMQNRYNQNQQEFSEDESWEKKGIDFDIKSVPKFIWESNEATQAAYLSGLNFVCQTNHKNCLQIYTSSCSLNFLQEIQIMLSNLGIDSKINLVREGGNYESTDEFDGKKDCFRLSISTAEGMIALDRATNILAKNDCFIVDSDPSSEEEDRDLFDLVDSVEYAGKEDVYCTTVESEEHLWVCNSFITSNCTEIFLPDNSEESFVCDLSSMNILHYDEWKDSDAVEMLVYFLDAVMTEFIEKASKISFMDRPVKFARRHRAIGIGWLGWHSFLQKNMVPFESLKAKLLNTEIAKYICEKAYAASAKMAQEYGEPEVLQGYGRRHTTLLAIAPTKSSAFILGQVSEGIEPDRANYYIKDLAKGKFTIKNKYLEELLESKGKNLPEIWDSILKNAGSVQHLKFLSDEEKAVFKTFMEISPKELIIQAAARQKYIDQGQSLNLMIHPQTPIKDVNALLIDAWKMGVKSLYYQISINAAQNFSRNILNCASCEA